MKLRHVAAIALVCLMVPSGVHAQSQLHIPPPPAAAPAPSHNTLEIPVVVKPNQPPLDPTFVGTWCGFEQFIVYMSQPPVMPEPSDAREGSTRCYSFTRSGGGGVAFDGGYLVSMTGSVRLVSQSAYAVSAHDIIVTDILDMSVPSARSTTTMTLNFNLVSPDRLAYTRTLRLAITTPDRTPYAVVTGIYGGDEHVATPGEIKAYDALVSGKRYIGGGDVPVPGAR